MALEQTINAESKSRLKSIIAFADVSTVVNRLVAIGSMRSQIVNSLLEIADMKNDDSNNKELNKHLEKGLENLKQQICANINSFN